MYINVNERLPVAKTSELDFIAPVLIDVLAPGEFHEGEFDDGEANAGAVETPEFLIGRIWAERLEWTYAEECEFPVFSVCNAASPVWMQVLETLTQDGFRFRKDLQLEDFVHDVLFVHEILLHPAVPERIAVVDACIRSATQADSLVLMHHEQGLSHHLEDWEYRDLGFKKIARSNLLLKDCHFRYPFSEKHKGGHSVKMVANVEHEQWLEEQWENLITDHPAL